MICKLQTITFLTLLFCFLGGLVEVVKLPGLNSYEGFTSREVQSSSFGAWPSSFSITLPNSLAIKLSEKFATDLAKLSKSSSKSIATSFIHLKNSMRSRHRSRLRSKNDLKAEFEWFPSSPSYIFGENPEKAIKTEGLANVEVTAHLKAFTIATSVKLTKDTRNSQTILGHSGCGGYELGILETTELVFKTR